MTESTDVSNDSGPADTDAPNGTALDPLRHRYAQWMGLDSASVLVDRAEPPDEVRAMQLVVRLERATPPSWTLALSAAASGAAALCLDPRSEPGGEWFDDVSAYCAGHIRKVTRRARAGQWLASGDLPGLTVERSGVVVAAPAGDWVLGSTLDRDRQLSRPPANETAVAAEVRVLVPGLVTKLDPRISRLQVGGTDVPVDSATDPGPNEDHSLRIWLPPEPQMTLGKTMAQAGHAGMIAAALLAGDDQPALTRWRDAGCPAIVHGRTGGWSTLSAAVANAAAAWRQDRLLAVRDAGFTEIAPGTVTVIAKAPR